MSSQSPSTLLPPALTLNVLWRHDAVVPLSDDALGRIARLAAKLHRWAYVRISLKRGSTWAAVAEAGQTPGRAVAPVDTLPAVKQLLTPPHELASTKETTEALLETNLRGVEPSSHWHHVAAPVCSATAALLGVVEIMVPVSAGLSKSKVERHATDCSALVRTELQHRYNRLRHARTETHAQQIADNLERGLYRSVPEEGIIYANQAFVDLLGYDVLSELTALPSTALYADPDDQARLLRTEQKQDGLDQFPVALRRYDGSTFKAHISSTVQRDEDGKVLYYDGVVTDATAKEAVEERLRRQEKLFRLLAQNVQSVVFVLDDTGTFLLVEGQDLDAIGMSSGSMAGASVFERYADFPEVLREFEQALAGEEVRDTLHIGMRTLDLWCAPLRNEIDQVVGCVGMATDVTERHEEREVRRQSVERWERLVEAHPDPILVSVDGRIRYANPASVQVLGAAHAGQLVGRELFDFFVDDGKRAEAAARLERVYKGTSSSLPREYTIQWKNQPSRIVEAHSVPITYQGEPAAQTIVRDITQQRETERMLRTERDLLKRIFNTSAAAITVTDERGTIVRANKRAEEVLGITAGALRGRAYNDPNWRVESVHGEAFPENRLPFYRVRAEEGPVYDVRHAVRWEDGTRKILSVNGAPLYGPDDHFTGAVFAVSDITDRVKAEQDLRAAKQEAEAASRLKTAMLANMSHEVRTPLTSIIGFADILAERTEGQSNHFAQLVGGSANRLLTTLDSVLRLAKLESGSESIIPEPVDVCALVRSIVSEKKQQAHKKDITLTFTCFSDTAHAHGEHGAVQRVVYNLVSNALKFTESGGTVAVRLAQGRKGVLIEVNDTGVGMTQAFQRRMFKAFTQESEGYAREHEGTGLGLALVRELVALMKGSVEVESTRGYGTRIAVLLPRTPVPPKTQAA